MTKNQTILILDDETKILLGLKALLQRSGYKVTTCDSSLKALEILKERSFDLILCDIMMPIMNGYKFKEAISANPVTRDIPFIFLTARTSLADKLKGYEEGADEYITKPFDPKELAAHVQAVFRRQEITRQANTLEMSRQIERIQTEISQNISHELRTPMTQILLALEMILRQKFSSPEDLTWFVETALTQSHRLNTLIDDMIFLNNHDSGPSMIFRQNVDIESSLASRISVRQDLYMDKNLQVEVDFDENVVVHAIPNEFRQAVIHLVDNAMKFSPPNSVVHIQLAPNGEGGCVLTVTDQGPGIPVEMQEKVFERYFQISQGITRDYGGLGVGLTICRIIARSLNGDVTFLPSEHGCRVQMILPPAQLDMP